MNGLFGGDLLGPLLERLQEDVGASSAFGKRAFVRVRNDLSAVEKAVGPWADGTEGRVGFTIGAVGDASTRVQFVDSDGDATESFVYRNDFLTPLGNGGVGSSGGGGGNDEPDVDIGDENNIAVPFCVRRGADCYGIHAESVVQVRTDIPNSEMVYWSAKKRSLIGNVGIVAGGGRYDSQVVFCVDNNGGSDDGGVGANVTWHTERFRDVQLRLVHNDTELSPRDRDKVVALRNHIRVNGSGGGSGNNGTSNNGASSSQSAGGDTPVARSIRAALLQRMLAGNRGIGSNIGDAATTSAVLRAMIDQIPTCGETVRVKRDEGTSTHVGDVGLVTGGVDVRSDVVFANGDKVCFFDRQLQVVRDVPADERARLIFVAAQARTVDAVPAAAVEAADSSQQQQQQQSRNNGASAATSGGGGAENSVAMGGAENSVAMRLTRIEQKIDAIASALGVVAP